MQKSRKNIFVAVSGGVDSSVALALLKQQGHDVTGCFMKNWSQNVPGLTCNWTGEREDAMRVCAALNVPFKTVDLEKTYSKIVFRNFISEYKQGRTPNPDVLCNSEVKFKAFLQWALRNGADMIATGHYARVRTKQITNNKKQKKFYALLAGADTEKDQSYFLYRLGQRELSYALFPIGDYVKPQVRTLARAFGLPTAEKKDSQGVCFVGEVALQQFLRNWIPEKRGKIIFLPNMQESNYSHIRTNMGIVRSESKILQAINSKQEAGVIGSHPGAWYFTIGQRHGLGLQGGSQKPLYVAAKDVKRNMLYVAEKNHPALQVKTLVLKNVHWVSGIAPKLPLACKARIRYRQPLQSCRIAIAKNKKQKTNILEAVFHKKQWAPAAGQSVVFYKGTEVLGGGVVA